MAAYRQKQMLDTGARAPGLELRDLEGHTHKLADMLQSGPVLLAFFKTTCPVCQFTFPFLERIFKGRGTAPLAIYAVSQDDAAATRDFNRRFGVTFPTLLDTEESGYPVSNAYGIGYVPTAFLIEPDGKISLTMEGFEKKSIESFAAKVGVKPFRPGENVPAAKAG